MSVLDRPAVNLGMGHEARWLWRVDLPTRPALPFGLLELHGPEASRCQTILRWADEHARPFGFAGRLTPGALIKLDSMFTLVSVDPLTIADLIGCPRCGAEGRITNNLWRPLPPDGTTLAGP